MTDKTKLAVEERAQTVEVDGVQISFRPPLVRDMIAADRIVIRLAPPTSGDDEDAAATDGVQRYYERQFARVVTQIDDAGRKALDLPAVDAPAHTLRKAFEAFQGWPKPRYQQIYMALEEADAPPGPKDTQPPSQLTEEERKN
ncbi:MAG TPA: hypothetical protein PKD09_10590 [Aggregatilinea sp.]|uniref:hypothetical protein n=1 Tax=Aggregatilinea sp. TaxID=2806333 RepID=UPI002C0C35FE|nr:hypothetical protein [Aggregatilinea sp.]HML22090.1 hypothetical protein [Aggregatilinea sp.]